MNSVESILLQNIDKPNSCFIFPTDIAVSRWADQLLRLCGGTIAMKKFIAWDVFKQNSIKSKVKNKKSIPSVLRKIFVSRLIRENTENCEEGKPPVFTSLIRTQWASQSSQFTSWLTGILPQLGAWFFKTTGLAIDSILEENAEHKASKLEGDDKDMFILAKCYAQFLEEHRLFEPAWETPPFNNDGTEYFLFFPESLSDYSEYRELLEASNHVKTISALNTESLPCDTFFYTNSRSEITEAALYIRALNEKQDISWDSIAVCIPDQENYEPYVLREFSNRNIPFVRRVSKPLVRYQAGQFFLSVMDCASQGFAFSAFASLVLNKSIPWKNTAQIYTLIDFGIKNNCISSWVEKKDGNEQAVNVWEDAFKKPFGGIDPAARHFFTDLKRRLLSLRTASSFAELRRQYFIFRGHFFDMDKCSQETDLILSRCISELIYLTEIEKDFPGVKPADPFLFFAEHLSEVAYLAQTKETGVSILPYRTAAAAPFDCHIILGAGQHNLSVVFSRLDFLPRKKREKLGIFDEDASAVFIKLHKFNSLKHSAFFCSEQTFSGFTIPHTKTGSPSEPKERYAAEPEMNEKFSPDHYNAEKSFSSSLYAGNFSAPARLHESQTEGFNKWKNRRLVACKQQGQDYSDKIWSADKLVQEHIQSLYAKKGKQNVSASSLQPYFQCSLKWLFNRVFALENVQTETSLMTENISGLVFHAVLNYFLTELKNKNEVLLKPDCTGFGLALPEVYRNLLEQSIISVFESFPGLKSGEKPQMSALTARLLQKEKKDIQYYLENCLAQFLSYFAGCRVTGSEISYEAEREEYILKGIVDCILKDSSDNYIIVDFKLKRIPARADCTGEEEKGLVNFQLPMYVTLTEENEKVKVFTALFYSILDLRSEVLVGTVQDVIEKKVLPKKEDERITRDSEQYSRLINEFFEKTEQFSQETTTGNFTVFESKNKNCYDCEYLRICRTVYIINRQTL
jgi:hypothetical protein